MNVQETMEVMNPGSVSLFHRLWYGKPHAATFPIKNVDFISMQELLTSMHDAQKVLCGKKMKKYAWRHITIIPKTGSDAKHVLNAERECIELTTSVMGWYRMDRPGVYKFKSPQKNPNKPYALLLDEPLIGGGIYNILILPLRVAERFCEEKCHSNQTSPISKKMASAAVYVDLLTKVDTVLIVEYPCIEILFLCDR